MPSVTFIQSDGTAQEVAIPAGGSVMEGAVNAGVPGIEATCGGACSCATCHVYVAEEWAGRTGAPDEMEEAMIEFTDDPRPTSRLSCQIRMTDALDGLLLEVPAQS